MLTKGLTVSEVDITIVSNSETGVPAESTHVPGPQFVCCWQQWPFRSFRSRLLLYTQSGHWGRCVRTAYMSVWLHWFCVNTLDVCVLVGPGWDTLPHMGPAIGVWRCGAFRGSQWAERWPTDHCHWNIWPGHCGMIAICVWKKYSYKFTAAGWTELNFFWKKCFASPSLVFCLSVHLCFTPSSLLMLCWLKRVWKLLLF